MSTAKVIASTTTPPQGAMTNGSSERTTKATVSNVVPAATEGLGNSSVTRALANASTEKTTVARSPDANASNGATTRPLDYQIPDGSTTTQNQNVSNQGQAFSTQGPLNGQASSTQGSLNSQASSTQGPLNGQASSTQSPPNGQAPDNLPDVIDASNIRLFLNDIGSKLSTEDLQRIDPSAVSGLWMLSFVWCWVCRFT